MTTTTLGTAADETALIAAIETAASSEGWTTYGPASTTPANSTWFVSSGSDGCSHIVGALVQGTFNTIRALVASDIDTLGIEAADVGGYVHDDTAALGTRGASITPDPGAEWAARDALAAYTYRIVVTKDAIAVTVSYLSSSLDAQGFIYIGKVEPAVRPFHAQAKAKIATVGAGSNGNQRLITLDRNITRMLKDQDDWPDEPAGYQQKPLFQAIVASSPADDPDLALVERIGIVPGTLTTSGGVTRFEIIVSGGGAGTKLAAAGQRYASNRGAGDIVRLVAEPTVAIVRASTALAAPFGDGTGLTILVSSDAYGGQRPQLYAQLVNIRAANFATTEAPLPTSNRLPAYRIYVLTRANETTLVAQADSEGRKLVGALYNVRIFPDTGQGDNQLVEVNGDPAERYRVMARTALDTPAGVGIFGVGPGW